MKHFVFVLAITSLLLAGCKEESKSSGDSTNSTVSGNPLDAPGEYLGGLAKSHQRAVKTVDTAAIKQAIDLFEVDKGRYPTDLNELVKEKFLSKIPEAPPGMKIVYEANSGTVKVVKE